MFIYKEIQLRQALKLCVLWARPLSEIDEFSKEAGMEMFQSLTKHVQGAMIAME